MKKILSMIFLFTVIAAPVKASEVPDIPLEGIAYDEKNPDDSIAVIGGEPHQKGRLDDQYEITKIEAASIEVAETSSGKKFNIEVKGPPPKPEIPQEPVVKDTSLSGKMNRVVGRAWELHALRELALINNASVKYFETREFFPRKMRSLTLDGYLDQTYESGERGKYRFYLDDDPNPDHLGVHADPADPSSGLKYFYIGEDAVIRESEGQPADQSSAEHKFI